MIRGLPVFKHPKFIVHFIISNTYASITNLAPALWWHKRCGFVGKNVLINNLSNLNMESEVYPSSLQPRGDFAYFTITASKAVHLLHNGIFLSAIVNITNRMEGTFLEIPGENKNRLDCYSWHHHPQCQCIELNFQILTGTPSMMSSSHK